MGLPLLASILNKIDRGEPLDEADMRYIRQVRERTPYYGLSPAHLLAIAIGVAGVAVLMVILAVSAA